MTAPNFAFLVNPDPEVDEILGVLDLQNLQVYTTRVVENFDSLKAIEVCEPNLTMRACIDFFKHVLPRATSLGASSQRSMLYVWLHSQAFDKLYEKRAKRPQYTLAEAVSVLKDMIPADQKPSLMDSVSFGMAPPSAARMIGIDFGRAEQTLGLSLKDAVAEGQTFVASDGSIGLKNNPTRKFSVSEMGKAFADCPPEETLTTVMPHNRGFQQTMHELLEVVKQTSQKSLLRNICGSANQIQPDLGSLTIHKTSAVGMTELSPVEVSTMSKKPETHIVNTPLFKGIVVIKHKRGGKRK